jgi:hypothetical protein
MGKTNYVIEKSASGCFMPYDRQYLAKKEELRGKFNSFKKLNNFGNENAAYQLCDTVPF